MNYHYSFCIYIILKVITILRQYVITALITIHNKNAS